MHTAIAQQSDQVKRFAGRGCFCDRGLKHGILFKLAVTNGLGYPSDIGFNYSSSSDIQMPGFRTASGTRREADVLTRGHELSPRIIGRDLIVIRRVSESYGVSILRIGNTPAVKDNKGNRTSILG